MHILFVFRHFLAQHYAQQLTSPAFIRHPCIMHTCPSFQLHWWCYIMGTLFKWQHIECRYCQINCVPLLGSQGVTVYVWTLGRTYSLSLAQAACSCLSHIGPGGLRAPCVLACAMRSLAIVITIIQSFFLSLFLSFSVFCFWPTSGKLPCAK